ncbi:MAG: 3'-5' exonuclease, partial [Deltaproteobacteria bacterium]|nr:3'-5' exonuclease [Deltaproteobacteria bacterium]
LNGNRHLPLTASLDKTFVAIDFEASGQQSGGFKRKAGYFSAGWDEITEIGYALFRRGRVIERGSTRVKPDVKVAKAAAKLTGLTARKLANAPRFEDPTVIDKLLKVMQGRPIVGQAFQKRDWAWLRSGLARLGVDLPKPKRMVLDTFLLSYAPGGPKSGSKHSLGALAEHYGINVKGELHDATTDAETTGKVFLAQMKQAGVKTLGGAFDAMHLGHLAQRKAVQARAELQRQEAQLARQEAKDRKAEP